MFDKFMKITGAIAAKVDENKYLSVIKTTFAIYLPFIVAGSFAVLGNSLLTSQTTGLAQFEAFYFLTNLQPAFSAVNFATMNIMTLAIVFIMGMELGKKNKVSEIYAALIALAAYIAVVPQSVTVVVEGVEALAAGLPVGAVNASGLFVGMILTVLVVEFFTLLTKIDKLEIKMPPSVPAQISRSFSALIPIFITMVTVGILGRLFVMATGSYLNTFIYDVLQAPMGIFFQGAFGIILIVALQQVFWLFGIHGGLVISPVRNPLLIAALAANIAAYEVGEAPYNIVTMGSWIGFIVLGGAGLTFSMLLAVFIASKKDDMRAVAKVAAFPAFLGISEPVVFGMPLVLNPIFAIPFVFASAGATAIMMFADRIGFLTANIVDVPFGLPMFVNGFLGWGLNGIIIQLVIVVFGTLFYLPFVLMDNRVKPTDEQIA